MSGKLGLGRNTSLVAVYGEYQVIHHQHHQVILTMVASSGANTGPWSDRNYSQILLRFISGFLMNLSEKLQPFMMDISNAISE